MSERLWQDGWAHVVADMRAVYGLSADEALHLDAGEFMALLHALMWREDSSTRLWSQQALAQEKEALLTLEDRVERFKSALGI